MRYVALVLINLLVLFAGVSQAAAERRVALVIGNSRYEQVALLPNPERDAAAVADMLKANSYEVTLETDLDARKLRDAVRRFASTAQGADTAIVYFAGHGLEIGGENYLIPTDAVLQTDFDIDFEAVPLNLLLRSMDEVRTFRLVILDACRNNPFAQRMKLAKGSSRSIGRGLARVDPTQKNTLIAYATRSGETADDGNGEHSPFAAAILRNLLQADLDVRLALGRVRDDVLTATQNRQEPFVTGSLGGEPIFLGGKSAEPAPNSLPPPESPPASPSDDNLQAKFELQYWQAVQDSSSIAMIESYVEKYPSGMFVAIANLKIAALRQQAALQNPPPPVEEEKPAQAPESGLPIKLAVVGPMTGPNAAFGEQLRRGTEMAVRDINAKGGFLGRQIELVVKDDASDPKQGVTVANALVQEGVSLVVGHFNSGVTIPASEIYTEKNILLITPSSTNTKVTDRGLWNVFRTCGRDDQQGKLWADYVLAHFRNKRVAIVHDKSAYGQGQADSAKGFLDAAGFRTVLYQGVDYGQKDYSAVVSKLRAARADVLLWGGLYTEAALIIRQMRDQGMRTVMISGDGITSDEFASIGGDAVLGTLMSFGPDPRTNPAAAEVLKSFTDYAPEGYTLYAYAAVQIFQQAAQEAGSLDPRQMADKMHSGMAFKTVLGDISYDERGDRTTLDYVMYKWKKLADGRISYVQE